MIANHLSFLTAKQQRQLIRLIDDERHWQPYLEQAFTELSQVHITWFGEPHVEQNEAQHYTDARIKSFRKMLGQETDILVIDCFAGLNPDALGALVGTVKLGGMCILLTPCDENWPTFFDPEYERIAVYPFAANELKGHFVEYFSSKFNKLEHALTFSTPAQWLAHIDQIENKLSLQTICSNPYREQHLLVDELVQLSTQMNSVQVVEADRGRGKSAALGIAAARLMSQQSNYQVALIAPLRENVNSVFRHCLETLAELTIETAEITKHSITLQNGSSLRFLAPDSLSHFKQADLIMVDEAAAIPATVLKPVFKLTCPLVMATTIHGYEGTGRGFELKTKPLLTKLRENVAVTTLVKPIRWREGDWLEASTNQLLLLDGKTTTLAVLRDKAGETFDNNLSFQFIPQGQLVKDQEQLEQIFTLLVDAHYQTSPQDLRNLLDSPNMLTFTLTFNNVVVAAAIISIEGNLPDDLIEGIWQGRRRPRGHLFPQSLICHSGLMKAGKFQFARIVRIAVLPEIQQQGIGSQLLANLVGYFSDTDVDLLCTSFGLSEELFSFWNKAGYIAVRLGLKAEASTGEKSIFMAKSLSSSSTNQMLHWQARFKQTMYVESNILGRRQEAFIARDDFVDETLSDQDKLDLHVFAQHFRGLDSCLLALLKLAKANVNFEILPDFVKDKLFKGLDNKAIIKSHGFSGEKQLVMAFRLWCAEALNRL